MRKFARVCHPWVKSFPRLCLSITRAECTPLQIAIDEECCLSANWLSKSGADFRRGAKMAGNKDDKKVKDILLEGLCSFGGSATKK